MIELNSCHGKSYTFIVDGNDGEEQLIVCISPGQGGRSPFIAVHMSSDGGGRVLESNISTVRNENIPDIFRRTLTTWSKTGGECADTRVEHFVRLFKAHFHMTEN